MLGAVLTIAMIGIGAANVSTTRLLLAAGVPIGLRDDYIIPTMEDETLFVREDDEGPTRRSRITGSCEESAPSLFPGSVAGHSSAGSESTGWCGTAPQPEVAPARSGRVSGAAEVGGSSRTPLRARSLYVWSPRRR